MVLIMSELLLLLLILCEHTYNSIYKGGWSPKNVL